MKESLPYVKKLAWWLGLIKRCPKCGSKLIISSASGWEMYKCSNSDCDFGKKKERYVWEFWK
ncbi:MAG: hypothetical protein ACE5IC_00195 [Candidatus Brocadiales bacterium]